MINYSREQLWEVYKKLPKGLQEAIFAEETANKIGDICKRNKIEDASKLAEYVGYILLGLLPSDEFQKVLISDFSLEEKTAKEISFEVHRFILLPVKEDLEELYNIKVTPGKSEEKETDSYKESI